MRYLWFSLGFIVIHTASYVFAGALALKLSKDLYEKKERLMNYLRDMSKEKDKNHVAKWFLPAQLIRGLFMSIVLFPVLGLLGEISFVLRFLFLGGLMFVYTDAASATPFSHNIEGLVYMKPEYLMGKAAGKLYLETFIYSTVFGLLAGWLLF